MLELRADSRNNHSRCPYCHARVAEGERVWACPRCETVHHQDCARENVTCTLLGCGELVTIPKVGDGGVPLPPVDRSPREAASSFQDFLVLGVSLPTLGAVALAGAKALGDRPSEDAVGYAPVLVALLAIALFAFLLRFARRRDQGEEPRPERRPSVEKT